MIYSLDDVKVSCADKCFIAPNAAVIGDVNLAQDTSVWFSAVIRGDTDTLTIGARSNIQDNSVIHTDAGIAVTIGEGVTIGHGCIVHGCNIGDNTLIGMGCTILNKARIGANCIIGAHALITQGMEIPDNSLVMGVPGKIVRTLKPEEIERNRINAQIYVDRGKQYLRQLRPQLD